MAVSWLAAGERELDGAHGQGFLQGVLLSETSAPRYTTATERRIVMLDGVTRDERGRVQATGVGFEVPWSAVRGYWTGVMPFPPDLWRVGAEGEVIVLCLEQSVSAGRDVVVHERIPAWVAASRAMGIAPVRD